MELKSRKSSFYLVLNGEGARDGFRGRRARLLPHTSPHSPRASSSGLIGPPRPLTALLLPPAQGRGAEPNGCLSDKGVQEGNNNIITIL